MLHCNPVQLKFNFYQQASVTFSRFTWSLQSGPAFYRDRGFFSANFFPFWKLFNYLWLDGKSLDRKLAPIDV